MFALYDINGVESDYYIQPIKNKYLIVKKVKNKVISGVITYRYIVIQYIANIFNIEFVGQQYYIDYDIFGNIRELYE